MKYVILEKKNKKTGDVPRVLVFAEDLVHRDVVTGSVGVHGLWTVRGAGFCYLEKKCWHVDPTRSSETLRIGPHQHDGAILNAVLRYGMNDIDLSNMLHLLETGQWAVVLGMFVKLETI
jgi:hypothetical protein